DPAPIGEQLGEAPADDQVEEPADERVLRLVREGLAAGAPNFAELLQLAGLVGPVRVNGDATIVAANGAEAATVDPMRALTEGVADARAELIAFALNTLANMESR